LFGWLLLKSASNVLGWLATLAQTNNFTDGYYMTNTKNAQFRAFENRIWQLTV